MSEQLYGFLDKEVKRIAAAVRYVESQIRHVRHKQQQQPRFIDPDPMILFELLEELQAGKSADAVVMKEVGGDLLDSTEKAKVWERIGINEPIPIGRRGAAVWHRQSGKYVVTAIACPE